MWGRMIRWVVAWVFLIQNRTPAFSAVGAGGLGWIGSVTWEEKWFCCGKLKQEGIYRIGGGGIWRGKIRSIPRGNYWAAASWQISSFLSNEPRFFHEDFEPSGGHPTFHNRGRFPQVSPMVQLMVALRRLGTEAGSGSAVMSVAQLFGIWEETLLLYIHRVVVAGFGLFEDCPGSLDSTISPFKFKPFSDHRGIQYVNHRKKAYGLQATIICDVLGRIVHFSLIYPAPVYDARCWRATRICRNPGKP